MAISTSPRDNVLLKSLGAVVLVMLSLFLIAKTLNAFAERDYIGKAPSDRDLITVSGTGKSTAKPDLALMSLGIQSEGVSVSAVQANSTQKMNDIIAALKGKGIADADIQTSNYSLQPKIDWNDGNQRITGYTLSQMVNVKIRDLNRVGELIEASSALGANQVSGVQFTIDDPSSLQDEARMEAIKDAQEKAEALANAVGLHIVKVVSFSEDGGYNPYPVAMAGREMDAVKNQVAPAIEAGSLDVNMNVSVTFEVR